MVTAIGRNWWQRVLFSDKATQSVKRKKNKSSYTTTQSQIDRNNAFMRIREKTKFFNCGEKNLNFQRNPFGDTVYTTCCRPGSESGSAVKETIRENNSNRFGCYVEGGIYLSNS